MEYRIEVPPFNRDKAGCEWVRLIRLDHVPGKKGLAYVQICHSGYVYKTQELFRARAEDELNTYKSLGVTVL